MITNDKAQPVTKTVKTGPQVLYRPFELVSRTVSTLTEYNKGTLTNAKVRTMRKDPTISMVRQLVIAPALLTQWSFEPCKDAPDGAVEFIKEQLEEKRLYITRTALFGCIDFGWQGFEKVFEEKDGKVVLKKLKGLLQDHVEILVKWKTGEYAGLKEENRVTGAYILLKPKKTFCHAFDVEGTYWYGQSYMAAAEMPYDQWMTANDANVRYDTKIAGSHWVIHYPMGVSFVNGEEKDNEVIAQEVLDALQSSGGIAVPKKIEEFINELDRETPNAWEIELISDTGATQTNFLERMAYLDKLKVRAFGLPERSILEGKYGTKAEASAHADFAIANMLTREEELVCNINQTIVDQLLALNYGVDAVGTVRIRTNTIGTDNKDFLRELYKKFIEDPKGFVAEFSKIDRQALRDVLSIPVDPEKDDETELFETALEDFEEQAKNKKDLPDELRNQAGLVPGVRPNEYREVGRPQQFFGPERNREQNNMGDLTSGGEDSRQATGRTVQDSAGDNLKNNN